MKGVLVVAALALAACGGQEGASAPTTSATSKASIDTGQVIGTAPTSAPTTTVARANPLGTEVRTALGNTVTVYAYQAPIAGRFGPPPSGKVYGALEVGGCVATGDQGPDPAYFDLVLPDSSRLRSVAPQREPSLRSTRLATGECIRGWVTYEVPEGVRPVAVVFNASSLVRWTIS